MFIWDDEARELVEAGLLTYELYEVFFDGATTSGPAVTGTDLPCGSAIACD